MRRFGLAMLVSVGLILAGCSSSSPNTSLPEKSSDESGNSGGTTTTRKPTTTTGTTRGTLYTAPGDEFTMRIGSSWNEISASPIAWQVAAVGSTGFKPNVNVVVTPTSGGGTDSEIVAELRKIPAQVASDSNIISAGTVKLASGAKGYQIEYTGTVRGNALHFYQVFSVGTDNTATVTLTAAQPDFAKVYAETRPFILTIDAS